MPAHTTHSRTGPAPTMSTRRRSPVPVTVTGGIDAGTVFTGLPGLGVERFTPSVTAALLRDHALSRIGGRLPMASEPCRRLQRAPCGVSVMVGTGTVRTAGPEATGEWNGHLRAASRRRVALKFGDEVVELLEPKRLGDHAVHTELCEFGEVLCGPGAHHDDARGGRDVGVCVHPPHDFGSVHSRHREVEQHRVEGLALERFDCLDAVCGGVCVVSGAFDEAAEDNADVFLVVHDQELKRALLLRRYGLHCHSPLSLSVTRIPLRYPPGPHLTPRRVKCVKNVCFPFTFRISSLTVDDEPGEAWGGESPVSARSRQLNGNSFAVFDDHKSLDHYARILRRVMDVPTARICLTEDRYGADGLGMTRSRVPSSSTQCDDTFCAVVMQQQLPLIVNDARTDARFPAPPAGSAGAEVVAFAGWPLHTDGGHTVGSLCVMDTQPRTWSVDDLDILADLAQACSAELHHSERRAMAIHNITQAIFDNVAGVAMAFFDADGRLLLANDFAWRAAEMAGFALDAAPYAGEHVYADDNTTPVRAEDQIIPRALRGEQVDPAINWVGAPGSQIALEGASSTVLHADGSAWGTLVVAHDVTRLARALRVKDDFIGTVAHELRTPLTSVIAYLELVADELPAGCDRVADAWRVIDRNAHDLQVRIDELVATAQRRRTLDRRPTDVADLLHTAAGASYELADAAGVRVTVDLDDACFADVDPCRIRQALENLISNSVKFSSPGNEVHLAVSSTPSDVQIVVEDSGTGMTADEVSQACELFWRAESTRRSATQGLGVGLTFVRDVVDMHGGTIDINSQPGSGTKVTLTFTRSEM